MTLRSRTVTTAAAMALAASAFGASGTGAYDLPWPVDGQVLRYRSCGCADACWKAEVRNTRTQAVLATLRCDCEHLSVWTPAHGAERRLPQACADLPDKPAFIRSTLQDWLAKSAK